MPSQIPQQSITSPTKFTIVIPITTSTLNHQQLLITTTELPSSAIPYGIPCIKIPEHKITDNIILGPQAFIVMTGPPMLLWLCFNTRRTGNKAETPRIEYFYIYSTQKELSMGDAEEPVLSLMECDPKKANSTLTLLNFFLYEGKKRKSLTRISVNYFRILTGISSIQEYIILQIFFLIMAMSFFVMQEIQHYWSNSYSWSKQETRHYFRG